MMQTFPKTLIIRHARENLKKCSLRGLESSGDYLFLTYPGLVLPDLTGYFLLSIEGEVLSSEDSTKGMLLLDGTWRYAMKMQKFVLERFDLPKRKLPDQFRTAYPRRQEECLDPERGLASIEALYAANFLLGRKTEGLLDNYHWKDEFLVKNQGLFS